MEENKRGEIEKDRVKPCCRLFGYRRSLPMGWKALERSFVVRKGLNISAGLLRVRSSAPTRPSKGFMICKYGRGRRRAGGRCMKRSLSQAGTVRRLSNSIGGKWLKPIKGEAAK